VEKNLDLGPQLIEEALQVELVSLVRQVGEGREQAR